MPLLLALAGATVAGAQHTLQLDAGLWQMGAEGTLAVGADLEPGPELDLAEDLGFGGSERVWQAGAVVGATHQAAVSYLAFTTEARTTTDRDLRFGGADFPAGARIKTELQGDLLGLGYRYAGGGDSWRSGFQAGLQLVSLETTLSSGETARGKGDLTSALPVVGVFAEWHPASFLQLQGSATGGSWDWRETSLTFLDAAASARLLLYPAFVGIGYRHLAVHGDDTSQPLECDLTFSGPAWFAGLLF